MQDLAFLRAMDQRNKLIDFERDRSARTTVIDDQSDFFDRWISMDLPLAHMRAHSFIFMVCCATVGGRKAISISLEIS